MGERAEAHRATASTGAPIEVEWLPARYPTFAAAVILRGEHDTASAPAVGETLSSICGAVLVDFSECTFCDSSIVRTLFDAGRARRRETQRIELVVPAANVPISRIFEITGLATQLTLHARLDMTAPRLPSDRAS